MKILVKNLQFGKPKKRPKGWYAKQAMTYIDQFLKAIKDGTCTTNMAKIVNPLALEEKMTFYNAIKALRRHKKISDVDVAIIEGDLWLIYEG